MKKITLITAILAIVFAFNANAQKKVLYITNVGGDGALTGVTGKSYLNDSAIVLELKTKFDVTCISAATPTTEMGIAQYDAVILSAVPSSGEAGLKALEDSSLTKPFVNLKSFQLQDQRWKWANPSNNSGIFTVTVLDAMKNHPLFNGIKFTGAGENEIILSTATDVNGVVSAKWGNAGGGTETVEILPLANVLNTEEASYYEIPAGSLINGKTLSHKQVVFGLSETAWDKITSDAIKMVVNAVDYVLTPGNFVKQWQFERWSTADINRLVADTALSPRTWYVDPADIAEGGVIKRFKNDVTVKDVLAANAQTLDITNGIKFPELTKSNLTLRNNYGDNGIQFGSQDKKITVSDLTAGQYLQVVLKSAKSGDARGISAKTNLDGATGTTTYGDGNSALIYNFTVTTSGNADFTYSGGIILKSILVTEPVAPTVDVANPTVEIAYNTTTKDKKVTITCTTEGAEIYYTTGGGVPTKDSIRYTEPFVMKAESFQIRSRAWIGESSSPSTGDKSWTDPVTFAVNGEYQIYSNGVDEGRGAGNPKYLYAPANDTIVRWIEVLPEETLSANLTNNGLTDDAALWLLSESDNNTYKIKNKANQQFIVKKRLVYALADTVAETSVAGFAGAGEDFSIAYKTAIDSTSYTYGVSALTGGAFEVNHGGSGAKPESADLNYTVHISSDYNKDRPRWKWSIIYIKSSGLQNPNADKKILSEQYFDVLGKRVSTFTGGAVIIRKVTYTDGSVEAQKLMIVK